jgi:hypothetical protein
MKALTLWQPWASAIAAGLKLIETRHWPTKYRGPLAIAATKVTPSPFDKFFLSLPSCEMEAFEKIGIALESQLPRSAIVCKCRLVDCVPMTPEFLAGVNGDEREWGIYAPGRWAWLLADVVPCLPAIPIKRCGRTLWNWDEVPF